MKLHHYAAAALCAMFGAGCSLQPAYQRPATPVAAAYPSGPAYQPAPAGAPPAAAADIGWRDFLTDARLQRLVELGLANNRDLRVAMLNVEVVKAQYALQRAALAPQLSADVNANAARTPASLSSDGRATTAHRYGAGLSAAWELDFFGKLASLSDAAQQQYLASAHARQAAEILLVAQIADQYLATLADDALLEVTRNTGTAAKAAYDLVKLQFDAGTASELDLRLAQTTVDQAAGNLAAQTRQRAQAENALMLLVGQPLPEDLPPPLPLGRQAILAAIPAGLPSDLLARRPDILQAEATLKAENANIGAARAAFFPSISLTGSAGAQSATLGGLFKAGAGAWAFAPALTLPIFDAGANRANLDVAKLNKDIGVAQYQKAIQVAFREVADGLAAQGTYQDQLAAQQRDTDSQQRRLDLENQLYGSGIDSYQNVLTAQTALYTAQQALYTAQQALVSARLAQLTGQVDLYRALGGGWIARAGETPRPADATSPGAPGNTI